MWRDRRALFPLFVAALTAAALTVGPYLAANPSSPILLVAIVATYGTIAALERRQPYADRWNEPQGDVAADTLHLLVTGPGSNVVYQATLALLFASIGGVVTRSLGMSLWPDGLPDIAQLFLAIAIAEFGHYWFHRLSHERPLLWRLHATHHSAERLYWLNATRFHPLDLIALIACQTLPLFLLGISERALAMYFVFSALYGQLQHANIDLDSGPFHRVFATPEQHRWHHAQDAATGNHNYGAILNLWDFVFGTYHFPDRAPYRGPIGIEDLPSFPRGYLAQLASPFRWPPRAQP